MWVVFVAWYFSRLEWFQKDLSPHQFLLKRFRSPCKNLQSSSDMLNVRSLKPLFEKYAAIVFFAKKTFFWTFQVFKFFLFINFSFTFSFYYENISKWFTHERIIAILKCLMLIGAVLSNVFRNISWNRRIVRDSQFRHKFLFKIGFD